MAANDTIIELSCGAAHAAVALAGAEWRTWSVDGDALLWTPDAKFWAQTAPVLFPVCGWTRDGQVRVDGKTYALGLHGFASQMEFAVVERGADFVRLLLRDNGDSRALYPFGFELEIEYRLTADEFSSRASVRNTGARTMPYAIGLHPGFRWLFNGGEQADYAILFDEDERAEVPVIAPGGLFSSEKRDIALEGKRLPLTPDTFAREALCLLDARSSGLVFVGPQGRAIRVEMDGYRHIVLWSRLGAPFLCIETWTGFGDPVGFSGELRQKPSMIDLPVGEEKVHSVKFAHIRALGTGAPF
jgi:galactose mutarotase-like enzyme